MRFASVTRRAISSPIPQTVRPSSCGGTYGSVTAACAAALRSPLQPELNILDRPDTVAERKQFGHFVGLSAAPAFCRTLERRFSRSR